MATLVLTWGTSEAAMRIELKEPTRSIPCAADIKGDIKAVRK